MGDGFLPAQEGRERRSGRKRAVGAGSLLLTPHLTSPLEGGRDELGKGGWCGCWVPACAGMTGRGRRNDGRGAGMTAAPRWCRVAGVNHAARQLTTAQRTRRAAVAIARSGGGGA